MSALVYYGLESFKEGAHSMVAFNVLLEIQIHSLGVSEQEFQHIRLGQLFLECKFGIQLVLFFWGKKTTALNRSLIFIRNDKAGNLYIVQYLPNLELLEQKRRFGNHTHSNGFLSGTAVILYNFHGMVLKLTQADKTFLGL